MFTCGPTFFSSGVGTTLFQCTFAGGSTNDVSSFAIGPATLIGASKITASAGNLAILQDTNTLTAAYWNNASFLMGPDSWCLEFMFALVASPAHPTTSDQKIGQVSMGAFIGDMYMAAESPASVNKFYWRSDGGSTYYTAGDMLGAPSFIHHFAIINRPDGGPNTVDIYYDGVRIAQNLFRSSSTAHLMQLGAQGVVPTSLTLNFKGVRVTAAQVYSDTATFTPPVSPADWGPPT
jgi:hypothetical protein